MNKRRYSYILPGIVSILSLLFIAGGCRVPQPLARPAGVQVPDTFRNQTDTSSVANIPWRQLFTDPYLRQLIDTALHRNFDLQMALQRVNSARAALLAARHAWLPSVDAKVSAGIERYGDYTLNGVGNFDTNLSPNISKDQRIPTSPTPDYFVGFSSSWEIDLWGRLRNLREAAYARFLASRQGRRLVETQLVAQVAGMYYELMALDNELQIIRRNIQLQEAAMATVSVQKAAGRATELAVQQFQAQLINTRSLEYNARQQITRLENELNALLGRFPTPIARDSSLLKAALPANIQTGIPAAMLLRRPDIQEAEAALAAARADVDAARKAFLPSLNITPYVGFNAFKASKLFQAPASLAYGVAGGLTAPLFNKKQLAAQYRLSQASGMSAFYRYQQTIVNGYQEVMTALNRVENQQQVFNLKEQEVEVLQNAVSTANILFSTGYASYLEVITAQRNVLEAELALTSSRKQIFLGIISLYQALGGGAS